MKDKLILKEILDLKSELYIVKNKLISLISEHGTLVSVGLNIPGWPKYNDKIEQYFNSCFPIIRRKMRLDVVLYKSINKAGVFYFLESIQTPIALKKLAIEIEEMDCYFRLIDIDCYNNEGISINRRALGYGERKCLLCNNDASYCIGNSIHDSLSLRKKAMSIIVESREKYHKFLGISE